MINGNILKLNGELISLEQLQEIEKNESVEGVQDNGICDGGNHYGQHWYTVCFNETFLDDRCNDVAEIQVYTK